MERYKIVLDRPRQCSRCRQYRAQPVMVCPKGSDVYQTATGKHGRPLWQCSLGGCGHIWEQRKVKGDCDGIL
jgi:hypothetical protein